MLQEILEKVHTFKKVVELAKLPDTALYLNLEVQQNLKYEVVQAAHRWIKVLFDNEYTEFIRFWRQRPDHYWNNLIGWGDDDFPELEILMKRVTAFRKKVTAKSKPDFFKRSRVEKLLKMKKGALRCVSSNQTQS